MKIITYALAKILLPPGLVVAIAFWMLWPAYAQAPAETIPLYLPLTANRYDPSWTQLAETSSLTLTPTPYTNDPPVVGLDNQGRAHLFWGTLSTPRFIYHAYQNENGWSAPAPVAESLGNAFLNAWPLTDAQGDVHILWHTDLGSGDTGRYRILYARFVNGQWQPHEEVLQTNSLYDSAGKLKTLSSGGLAAVIEVGYLSTQVNYATRNEGGWQAQPVTGAGFTPSMAWPDAQGGAHLFASNINETKRAYWLNGSASAPLTWPDISLYSRRTVLDGAGNLHTFWSASVPVPGNTVTGAYYRCLGSDLAWRGESVVSGYAAASSRLRMALDDSGRVAMAWHETGAQRVWVILPQGCDQQTSHVLNLPAGSWELTNLAYNSRAQKACVLLRKLPTQEQTLVCAAVRR